MGENKPARKEYGQEAVEYAANLVQQGVSYINKFFDQNTVSLTGPTGKDTPFMANSKAAQKNTQLSA